MKTNNVRLLTAMTSILLVMAVPAAFGQSTPSTHAADVFPTGTQEPLTLFQFAAVNNALPTPAPAGLLDIFAPAIYVYYSPTGSFSTPALPGTCAAVTPTGAGDMMWRLYHSSGVPVTAEHTDIGINTPSVLFFDSIDPTTVPGVLPKNTITPAVAGDGFGSGGASTTAAGAGTAISPAIGAGFYYWQKISAAGLPIAGPGTTGQQGAYTFVMCGFIDSNDNDTFESSVDGANIVSATIFIDTDVGGESLPISSTALLVSGAQTNALWILPILGLAGTIIAIRKLEA